MLGPSRESECILPVFQRESPQRRVYVSRYAIEQTEVSNRQLAAWLNTQQTLSVQMDPKGSKTEARWVRNKKERLVDLWPTRGMVRGLSRRDSLFQAEPGTEDLPAVQVSWTAASAYCASIGRRLPTEAEWEYAARTDKNLTFPWGAADPTCEGVVIARNPEDRCYRVGEQLSPVHLATQDRTAEGVLNLGGNVAEWVQDAYVPSYQPCTEPCRDPVVKEAGRRAAGKNLRIFRGGSWSLPIETARGATRSRAAAHTLAQTIGFRCAVSR
jgi:formylglycine-generating enzyme required for sulfatase activity